MKKAFYFQSILLYICYAEKGIEIKNIIKIKI